MVNQQTRPFRHSRRRLLGHRRLPRLEVQHPEALVEEDLVHHPHNLPLVDSVHQLQRQPALVLQHNNNNQRPVVLVLHHNNNNSRRMVHRLQRHLGGLDRQHRLLEALGRLPILLRLEHLLQRLLVDSLVLLHLHPREDSLEAAKLLLDLEVLLIQEALVVVAVLVLQHRHLLPLAEEPLGLLQRHPPLGFSELQHLRRLPLVHHQLVHMVLRHNQLVVCSGRPRHLLVACSGLQLSKHLLSVLVLVPSLLPFKLLPRKMEIRLPILPFNPLPPWGRTKPRVLKN